MKRFALVPVLLLFAFHATATDPAPPTRVKPVTVTVDGQGEIHQYAISKPLPFGHLFYEGIRKADPVPAPALTIPDTITPVGDYATFAPDATTTVKAVTYIGVSGVSPFPSAMLADKRAFVLPTRGLSAGKYVFIAVGSLNDVHVQKQFAVIIVGGTPQPPQPDPGPGPSPGPGPAPQPVASRLAVVIVEDGLQRTPAQGATINDPALRSWLIAGKHTFFDVSKNEPVTTSNGYLDFANSVGLPAVLVFDANKTGPQSPIDKFKLPASGAELKARLGKLVNP